MARNTDQPAAAPSTQDARQLVESDHRAVRALLADLRLLCERGAAAADRQGQLARLASLLRVHGRIEREILYPALVGRADAQLLAQAGTDHDGIDALLGALAADASGARFAERLAALAAAVESHLDAEERQLLPALGGLDLAALGVELALRRGALQAEAQPD